MRQRLAWLSSLVEWAALPMVIGQSMMSGYPLDLLNTGEGLWTRIRHGWTTTRGLRARPAALPGTRRSSQLPGLISHAGGAAGDLVCRTLLGFLHIALGVVVSGRVWVPWAGWLLASPLPRPPPACCLLHHRRRLPAPPRPQVPTLIAMRAWHPPPLADGAAPAARAAAKERPAPWARCRRATQRLSWAWHASNCGLASLARCALPGYTLLFPWWVLAYTWEVSKPLSWL